MACKLISHVQQVGASKYTYMYVYPVIHDAPCTYGLAISMCIFALKKARASGRNVGKVFNPVLKLVFENYPFSCALCNCTLSTLV